MAYLITFIFATYHPNWVGVQTILNILLMTNERCLVLDKANKGLITFIKRIPKGPTTYLR